jgi:hypothetical protein
MKYLWSSPCSRAGLSPRENPFPCLEPGGDNRTCPMNSAQCQSIRATDAEMYQLGYTYGAWVVREDPLGLSPVCSLTFFRERPTPEDLDAIYGTRLLHLQAATPICPPACPERPLDREVLPAAAD